MIYAIKELRAATGLTQIEFSKNFGIPVSTLRKWEQGEARPAPYVINLLSRQIPMGNSSTIVISSADKKYYYNPVEKSISDAVGNKIFISEDLEGVKKENLPLYVKDLFEDFYVIQEKFNSDCRYDKKEDIIWV